MLVVLWIERIVRYDSGDVCAFLSLCVLLLLLFVTECVFTCVSTVYVDFLLQLSIRC